MKNNQKDAVLKIAEFLEREFVIKMKDNNEFLLNKVIENSTINAMKDNLGEEMNGIVRKVIVGDYKNHFNSNESDSVDENVRQLWTETGLENLWAEDMKW
jgi:type IV secretory pathway VirD2 relaxase